MRLFLNHALAITLLATSVHPNLHAADDQSGQIDFGEFKPSAEDAEFIEVNVQRNLINLVARMTEKSEPEVAEVLHGLHQVRVNVMELTDDNRQPVLERIESIHKELQTKAWEKIVTARTSSDDVSVYLKMRTDEAVEGIVVTVIENSNRAVLVNIVGNIQPDKIALLGERFEIEPLRKIGGPFAKRN